MENSNPMTRCTFFSKYLKTNELLFAGFFVDFSTRI
jgi:hypothetical protein